MKNNIYKYAAIDAGSNAVRLLLSNVTDDNGNAHFTKSEFIRIPLRLGEDVFKSGRISSKKAKQFIKTMTAFKLLIDVFDPLSFRACATASLREAKNGEEIIGEIKKLSGLNIEIITGKTEAELIYSNHVEELFSHDGSYLYIDVGGGSTEISLFDKGNIIVSASFKVGTLRWLAGTVKETEWNKMKEWVSVNCSGHFPLTAIGSGGNINKIFKILEKREKELSFLKLKIFYDQLKMHSVEERMEIWDLNPDRADVILPGARIYLAVMKAASIQNIIVPEIGLVDGIIHSLHDRNLKIKK